MPDLALPDPAAVLREFGLPGSVTAVTEVSGGWSNRVLRLDTTQGSYALKEIRNAWGEPRWREWLDEGWRLELAAMRAGVAVPEPVPHPATGGCAADVPRSSGDGLASVRVHRWVDAVMVVREPVGLELARWVGAALATVHRLALRPASADLYAGRFGMTTADCWPSLVTRSASVGAPWTEELAAGEAIARRATGLLGTWDPAEELLCHADVDQRNLLMSSDGPMLCDWDVVVPRLPAHDLAEAAMSMACWRDLAVVDAVLRGYREAGGEVAGLGPPDLGPSLASRLGWIRFTVDRAVDARAADDGMIDPRPDVAGLLSDLERRVTWAERFHRT